MTIESMVGVGMDSNTCLKGKTTFRGMDALRVHLFTEVRRVEGVMDVLPAVAVGDVHRADTVGDSHAVEAVVTTGR